jgi:hypothetical protein
VVVSYGSYKGFGLAIKERKGCQRKNLKKSEKNSRGMRDGYSREESGIE